MLRFVFQRLLTRKKKHTQRNSKQFVLCFVLSTFACLGLHWWVDWEPWVYLFYGAQTGTKCNVCSRCLFKNITSCSIAATLCTIACTLCWGAKNDSLLCLLRVCIVNFFFSISQKNNAVPTQKGWRCHCVRTTACFCCKKISTSLRCWCQQSIIHFFLCALLLFLLMIFN